MLKKHLANYKSFISHLKIWILGVIYNINTVIKAIIKIQGQRCRIFAKKKNHGMGKKNDTFYDSACFFIILGKVSLFFSHPCFLFPDTVMLFIYNIGLRSGILSSKYV